MFVEGKTGLQTIFSNQPNAVTKKATTAGTDLAAEQSGPSPAGTQSWPTSLCPDLSLSFWPSLLGQIRSRSMKHIPAPLNQCHVYSFALKNKTNGNQLQTRSRIPRNQNCFVFYCPTENYAFAPTMNDLDGLVILLKRTVLVNSVLQVYFV